MKFVRFVSAEHPDGTYGLVGELGSIEVISGGLLDPVEKTGEIIHESQIIQYLPPVNPPNMLAMGLNYSEHITETGKQSPPDPLLFIKATSCLSHHCADIVLPKVAPDMTDYEAELVVIVGRAARNVTEEEALDHVFGYTCGNDVSARDCQAKDGQWARAKSFDTYGPMGPYVVTDIDAGDLHIQMRLNGILMQDASTKSLVFGIPRLISYLSKGMTLLPGTAIWTGTPGGVGVARVPPVFLKPGDVCEVDIEGLGTLRNAVVAE